MLWKLITSNLISINLVTKLLLFLFKKTWVWCLAVYKKKLRLSKLNVVNILKPDN